MINLEIQRGELQRRFASLPRACVRACAEGIYARNPHKAFSLWLRWIRQILSRAKISRTSDLVRRMKGEENLADLMELMTDWLDQYEFEVSSDRWDAREIKQSLDALGYGSRVECARFIAERTGEDTDKVKQDIYRLLDDGAIERIGRQRVGWLFSRVQEYLDSRNEV